MLDDYLNLISKIHSSADNSCYIPILKKWTTSNKNKLQDRLFLPGAFTHELIDIINNKEEDVYFGINSFYKQKKNTKNVRQLNCFALDFDFYKKTQYKNLTPNQFYIEVLKDKLPFKPTAVVNSGRGLYILYTFNNSSYKVTGLYKCCYNAFYKLLKDFGMDAAAMNVTQVIRVPGSYNPKSNTIVNVIELNDTNYSLSYIADNILPFSREEYKTFMDKKLEKLKKYHSNNRNDINSHIINLQKNTQSLIADFSKLIEIRNKKDIVEGYRELLIYLCREYMFISQYNMEYQLNMINKLNKQFKCPMTEYELNNATKPPSTYRKPTSITKIIDKLNITAEERSKLTFLRFKKEKDCERKKRCIRDIRNITNKQSQMLIRRVEVLKLKRNGLLNHQIAKKLNITKSTVTRDLIYCNENRWKFVLKLKEYIDRITVILDEKDKSLSISIVQLTKWLKMSQESLGILDG